MVKEIQNAGEFNQLINGGKVVVDFYAVWCGPCVQIKPFFEQLSNENPGVTFAKVNVDQPWARGLMQAHKVGCMPTFLAFDNGKLVDRLEGASQPALTQLVQKLG